MALALVPVEGYGVGLAELGEAAWDYVEASRAKNTARSYQTGWRQFEVWCDIHGLTSLPANPSTVALYVTHLATKVKPGTIDARLAAIAAAHRAAGHPTPTKAEAVRLVRRGVRRTVGTAQRQVRPVTTEDLRAMVGGLHDDTRGVRDRALLLMGFAGALRRSELVGLDVGDVVESSDGLTVRVQRSKTDQEGEWRTVGVPYGSNPATWR